ncbi:MAG: choline oxidase [Gammaproteobacteria bacterium]|jgi:choline oxidase
MNIPKEADYIVVGGGAAGCIIARRLADALDDHILLIEAGKSDEGDPAATDLSRLDDQDDSYHWGYHAKPTHLSDKLMDYARARMLGGCANHNDCAFLKPPPEDFDEWVKLGAKGWSYENLEPAFKAIENRLYIESAPQGNALSQAFIDANLEQGLEYLDFREQIKPGAGWFPLNAKSALRQSSSIGYLHPLKSLPENLEVLTNTQVKTLVMDDSTAVAVETTRGRITARREIILCAGSINSPQLLMLSGIGPGSDLQSMNIPVIQSLDGVGKNLSDHVAANIACDLKVPPPPYRLTPCEATALIKIDRAAANPDILFHFVLRLRDKYIDDSIFSDINHGIKLSPNVARPKSRGSLQLISPDYRDKPQIDLNYLSDAEGYDQRLLIAGLKYARKLTSSESLKSYIKREAFPGIDVVEDSEWIDYIHQTCETVYHPVGTCKAGSVKDPTAVVDENLRVIGVDQLRVADASIFPAMVSVNICNTVMAVAEQASRLIIAGK